MNLMLARWLPRPRRHEEARREYRFGHLEFAVVRRGWRDLSTAVRVVSGESRSIAYFRSARTMRLNQPAFRGGMSRAAPALQMTRPLAECKLYLSAAARCLSAHSCRGGEDA